MNHDTVSLLYDHLPQSEWWRIAYLNKRIYVDFKKSRKIITDKDEFILACMGGHYEDVKTTFRDWRWIQPAGFQRWLYDSWLAIANQRMTLSESDKRLTLYQALSAHDTNGSVLKTAQLLLRTASLHAYPQEPILSTANDDIDNFDTYLLQEPLSAMLNYCHEIFNTQDATLLSLIASFTCPKDRVKTNVVDMMIVAQPQVPCCEIVAHFMQHYLDLHFVTDVVDMRQATNRMWAAYCMGRGLQLYKMQSYFKLNEPGKSLVDTNLQHFCEGLADRWNDFMSRKEAARFYQFKKELGLLVVNIDVGACRTERDDSFFSNLYSLTVGQKRKQPVEKVRKRAKN